MGPDYFDIFSDVPTDKMESITSVGQIRSFKALPFMMVNNKKDGHIACINCLSLFQTPFYGVESFSAFKVCFCLMIAGDYYNIKGKPFFFILV